MKQTQEPHYQGHQPQPGQRFPPGQAEATQAWEEPQVAQPSAGGDPGEGSLRDSSLPASRPFPSPGSPGGPQLPARSPGGARSFQRPGPAARRRARTGAGTELAARRREELEEEEEGSAAAAAPPRRDPKPGGRHVAPGGLTFFLRSRERLRRLRLVSSFSFCSCRACASMSLIFFSCLAA